MNTSFINNKKFYYILELFSVYIIILMIRGFLFASNDLVDVMSYAKYLNDASLYPKDFYIQHIAHTLPNERIIFAGMLALFGKSLSWVTLLFHAIASLFLLSGIYKISELFIRSKILRWLVPLALFIPLYGIGPGDCELYYNMFIASLAAKSIGIWALYYFMTEFKVRPYLLLIPATLIHPTVGAQLFLIFAGTDIIRLIFWKNRIKLTGIIAYLISAGIYLSLLQFRVYDATVLTTEQLFEIFEFRLAHHFFPAYFGIKNFISGFVLVIAATLFLYMAKSYRSMSFVMVTIAGMIIYTISISFAPVEIILSSQWFKSYIWLELLGVIAILAIFDRNVLNKFPNIFPDKLNGIFLISALIFTAIFTNIIDSPLSGQRYDFFFRERLSTEAEIGLLAKEHTPEDALIIVPMDFTEFKYYSERSLFIDYKSVVHRKDALPEWYRRIQLVYNIDITDRRAGENLYLLGKRKYSLIDLADLEEFRREGIEYIVAYSDQSLPLKLIASNNRYRIYQL